MRRRGAPAAITVDNGGEFVDRAMDAWSCAHDVRLEFMHPGKPIENASIESFNGRLRDECLNVHVFASKGEAQIVFDAWCDIKCVARSDACEMDTLWVDSREPPT